MAQAVLTPEVSLPEAKYIDPSPAAQDDSRAGASPINWNTVLLSACALVVVFEIVRAALRFEHWGWMVR